MGNSHQTRRNSQKTDKGSNDSVSNITADPKLSKVEMRLIKKHWTQARKQGVEEPGLQILLEIFRRMPEIEQLFINLDEEKKKEAEENYQFPFQLHGLDQDENQPNTIIGLRNKPFGSKSRSTAHAQRFCKILDIVIERLDNLETVCPMLKILGYRHSKLAKEPTGFNQQYWDVFAEVLVEKSVSWSALSRAHRNTATVAGWCRLVLFVISQLKKGFEEARRLRSHEHNIHQQCMTEIVDRRKKPPIYVSNILKLKAENQIDQDFKIPESDDSDAYSII